MKNVLLCYYCIIASVGRVLPESPCVREPVCDVGKQTVQPPTVGGLCLAPAGDADGLYGTGTASTGTPASSGLTSRQWVLVQMVKVGMLHILPCIAIWNFVSRAGPMAPTLSQS